jgi:hypothetical protein
MQEKCMEFVGQMSGVAQVTLFSDKDNTDMVSNSYFPARSGDLILTPSAGYADDDGTAAAYNYNLHVPLCFYGGRIQPKTIDTPIDMTSVVPTIALMLAAPLPAAARGIPIGRGISKE